MGILLALALLASIVHADPGLAPTAVPPAAAEPPPAAAEPPPAAVAAPAPAAAPVSSPVVAASPSPVPVEKVAVPVWDSRARTDKTDETAPAPAPVAAPRTGFIALEGGRFRPDLLNLGGQNYGGEPVSFMGEIAWAGNLIGAIGLKLEEGIAVSTFTGSVQLPHIHNLSAGDSTYSLDLIGLDSRLMYSLDWFPIPFLIPFVDGGYLYTFCDQHGSSVDSTSSWVGNAVFGGGVRVVLNPNAATTGGMSFAVLLKASRIFANSTNAVNLGSTSYLIGLTLGI